MIELINGREISVRFVKEDEMLHIISSANWTKKKLSDATLGEIYLSNSGNIVCDCIYGSKGLYFDTEDDYESFLQNCSFVYIKSRNVVFFIEHIESAKYDFIKSNVIIKKDIELSNQTGSEIYFDENRRLYELNSDYKSGFVYKNIREFLEVRKEYGFDDSNFYIFLGDEDLNDSFSHN